MLGISYIYYADEFKKELFKDFIKLTNYRIKSFEINGLKRILKDPFEIYECHDINDAKNI